MTTEALERPGASDELPCEHLVVELRRFRNRGDVRVSCPRQCGCRIFGVVGEYGRATLHRHGPNADEIVGELDLRDGAG
jgi:hypothetical protein